MYVAGQAGTDDSSAVLTGGLAAQVRRALLNVFAAMEAAGATNADLARLTYYVVDRKPAMFGEFAQGVRAARAEKPFADVASTLIGVTGLVTVNLLVEIDAVAVAES